MRKWRVGTISMGILLIATGLVFFIGEINGFNGASMILRWWPIILIVLGLEILGYIMFSGEEQPKIKFDGLSIFMAIFIILVSSGVYTVNRFMESGFSQGIFGDMGYFKNESIVNKTYDLDAAKVKTLQIDNSKGQIQVNQYDGSKIKVDVAVMIKNNDEEAALKLAQNLVEVTEGETLTLNTRNVGVLQDNKNYQITVNYAVKVPKALEYKINNKFGEITLEDLIGNVQVDGKFGKVELDNIQGNVKVENAFGETRVDNVTGKVEIDNEHGEIFLSNKQAAKSDINLNCKMGGITVELPHNQQGRFDAYTKFGGITFEGFDTNLSVEQDTTVQEVKGTIGSASPLITVNASHGAINFNGQ